MRRSLGILAVALLAAACGSPFAPVPPTPTPTPIPTATPTPTPTPAPISLTIAHTNDVAGYVEPCG